MAEHVDEKLDGGVVEGSTPSEVGVSGDGSTPSLVDVVTEESVPRTVLEGGVSSAMLSNGRQHEVEMTSITTADSVGGASGHGSVALHGASSLQEPSVVFVVKDVTQTDWQKSRYTYSLSQSSAVVDLYAAIAKEAGRTHVWLVCVHVCVCACVSL